MVSWVRRIPRGAPAAHLAASENWLVATSWLNLAMKRSSAPGRLARMAKERAREGLSVGKGKNVLVLIEK